MWCHVTLVRTNISEECIASRMRVEKISELATTLTVNSNWSTLQKTAADYMKTEAIEWDAKELSGGGGLCYVVTKPAGRWHTMVWKGLGETLND
jgi:hypothetical protein